MTEWKDVATVLLGSWPSQVASWGAEGLAAYLAELKSRNLSPDQAVVAIRSCEAKFPPSAGELFRSCRVSATRPTFAEAYLLIFGRGGAIHAAQSQSFIYQDGAKVQQAEHSAILERARRLHHLIGSFVERQGIERLRNLPLEDPNWGERYRRDLEAAWDRHVDAHDGREVAAIASGSPEEVRRLDPLTILEKATQPQLTK